MRSTSVQAIRRRGIGKKTVSASATSTGCRRIECRRLTTSANPKNTMPPHPTATSNVDPDVTATKLPKSRNAQAISVVNDSAGAV
jgi:hypothetical protein